MNGSATIQEILDVLVLIISGIIVLVGFLPGVGVGILIAVADFLIKYRKLNVIKAELSGRYYRRQHFA